MMGAGKTTVGRRLARALGWRFEDIDQAVESRTGVPVSTVFEIEGEAGFRRREAQALGEISSEEGVVVATGGGAVLDPLNRVRMTATGFVVFLHAAPEMLYARTRHDKSRPLLQVTDPLGRIAQLVTHRDPLYREIADLVVESGAGLAPTLKTIEDAIAQSA